MKKPFKILLMIIVVLSSIGAVKAENIFSVEYIGGADEIVIPKNDFFSNFDKVLPGDILSDSVDIVNKSNKDIKVYFKTEPIDKREYELEEDYKLLDKIRLTIDCCSKEGEKNIYDGKLRALEINEFVELGIFEKEKDAELRFSLFIPSTLKNEYDMTKTKVKWIFGISETNENKPRVKTNDDTPIILYLAIGGITLCGIALLERRRENEPNKKNEK